jgi:hypothetical protein
MIREQYLRKETRNYDAERAKMAQQQARERPYSLEERLKILQKKQS